jgi:DNA-binding CsgD family transcriptional regulator
MKRSCILFICLLIAGLAGSQKPDIEHWVTKLKDESARQAIVRFSIYQELSQLDSAKRITAVNQLEQACAKGNKRLHLLAKSVKEKVCFYTIEAGDSLYAAHMKACLNEAIQLEETNLQAEFGRWYSEMLNSLNQKELAVQYAISALQQQEYLGLENFPAVAQFYLWLGESLMVTDYLSDAMAYLHKGLHLAKNDTLVKQVNIMFTYNNLGIIHRRIKQHDSALYYFDKLQAISTAMSRKDWVDIAHKNRMQSLIETGQLDSAEVEAENLLQKSRVAKNTDDEMYAAEMLGKIAFARKEFATALVHLLYSQKLNGGKNQRALSRVNEKLAATYEALQQPDKAYPYLKALRQYNDSILREKENSKSRYLAIKASYEKEQLRVRELVSSAHNTKRTRNISIAVLVALSIIGMWWIHANRQKTKRLQLAAAEQLNLFKEEIISKNAHIDGLMQSLQKQQYQKEDTQRIEELSRQMILTDDDWQNFKQLFEQTYPAFFSTLRQKATGITEAEQRMAALLKIQLNTKQIAAMQGISADSVHKTRQRLRQRLGMDSTAELENMIASI